MAQAVDRPSNHVDSARTHCSGFLYSYGGSPLPYSLHDGPCPYSVVIYYRDIAFMLYSRVFGWVLHDF